VSGNKKFLILRHVVHMVTTVPSKVKPQQIITGSLWTVHSTAHSNTEGLLALNACQRSKYRQLEKLAKSVASFDYPTFSPQHLFLHTVCVCLCVCLWPEVVSTMQCAAATIFGFCRVRRHQRQSSAEIVFLRVTPWTLVDFRTNRLPSS
jgi:hypothetical protein